MLGGHSASTWIAFNALVVLLLYLDLGVLNRRAHAIELREALWLNVLWTAVGLAAAIWFFRVDGTQAGLEYVTGYVIERALSFDNIFVFVVIFGYFRVPAEYQHRVLYWGILGALIMRGVLIVAGAALVATFHWVLYVFGAFLVYSGVALLVRDDEPPHPDRNPAVRLARRILPVDTTCTDLRFVVRRDGRLHATPLLIVLIVVETTDLVFALDSIPAIFAVTREPFIIYSSNVFAILGLRAMYFLLAALMPRFRYLKHGLSLVLALVGLRMLTEPWVEVPTAFALLAVCAILIIAVAASAVASFREKS